MTVPQESTAQTLPFTPPSRTHFQGHDDMSEVAYRHDMPRHATPHNTYTISYGTYCGLCTPPPAHLLERPGKASMIHGAIGVDANFLIQTPFCNPSVLVVFTH